jgi:hypothetical protein
MIMPNSKRYAERAAGSVKQKYSTTKGPMNKTQDFLPDITEKKNNPTSKQVRIRQRKLSNTGNDLDVATGVY